MSTERLYIFDYFQKVTSKAAEVRDKVKIHNLPASEGTRVVANFKERKNLPPPRIWCKRICLSVCLSVTIHFKKFSTIGG